MGEEGRKKDFRGCVIFSFLSWLFFWGEDVNVINFFVLEMWVVREWER